MYRILILIAITLILVDCDPGLHLQPINWTQNDLNSWVKTKNKIQFKTKGLGGLIGEDWENFELSVINNSTETILLNGATLIVNNMSYKGKVIKNDIINAKKQSISSGKAGKFWSSWKFNKPLFKVYNGNVKLILNFKLGEETFEIRIPFKKIA